VTLTVPPPPSGKGFGLPPSPSMNSSFFSPAAIDLQMLYSPPLLGIPFSQMFYSFLGSALTHPPCFSPTPPTTTFPRYCQSGRRKHVPFSPRYVPPPTPFFFSPSPFPLFEDPSSELPPPPTPHLRVPSISYFFFPPRPFRLLCPSRFFLFFLCRCRDHWPFSSSSSLFPLRLLTSWVFFFSVFFFLVLSVFFFPFSPPDRIHAIFPTPHGRTPPFSQDRNCWTQNCFTFFCLRAFA